MKFNKLPLLILLAFYTYLLAKPIDLSVTDIGRHLINGREILHGNWEVLTFNFYSHTLPDQQFVNHHWLTGVVFWLIYEASGFLGLHLFHTVIAVINFTLLVLLLKKHGGAGVGFLLGVVATLLMASRGEVRPETFGLLLHLNYLHFIFWVRKTGKFPGWAIAWLVTLQIFWTNFHISFVFGPFLFCWWWLTNLWEKNKPAEKLQKKLLLTWVMLGLVTMINPNGLAGALTPLTILENYGYRVFENQTLWFLRNFYPGPIIPLFYLISGVVVVGLVKFKNQNSLFVKSLGVIGIVLGFVALRNLPLFVIFTLPLLAEQLQLVIKKWRKKPLINIEQPRLVGGILLAGVFGAAVLLSQLHPVFGKRPPRHSGFGLIANQEKTIQALQQLPPGAKIFNNYDIGSMLIFTNYQNNFVFVDNRPEAYSAEFFQDHYIPIQEDEQQWQQAQQAYNFDYLVIGHRDLTSWTQTFLASRVKDPAWQLIYQDNFAVIFAAN